MSTRSIIIEKTVEGYRGIYVHWDGYARGVGATLLKHYTDPKKVFALINLGSLSSLGEKVNPTDPTVHTFDSPEKNVTVAYGRDRGEEDQEPVVGITIEQVAGHIDHNGYVYVFENNEWTCNGMPLDEAVRKEI